MSAARAALLQQACVCGHDHTTHRDEHVDLCLELDLAVAARGDA